MTASVYVSFGYPGPEECEAYVSSVVHCTLVALYATGTTESLNPKLTLTSKPLALARLPARLPARLRFKAGSEHIWYFFLASVPNVCSAASYLKVFGV